MNETIKLAKTAGFCFGVKRALSLLDEAILENSKVSTLGPIIHNKIVLDEYISKKVNIIENVEQLKKDECLVLRSHGVSEDIKQYLISNNIKFIDSTCPFVLKIHKIVNSLKNHDFAIILGNKEHPEIIGIVGNCHCENIVLANSNELKKLNIDFSQYEKVVMLSQTTFSSEEWDKSKIIAKKIYTKIEIFDTICQATSMRQQEAAQLGENSDLMVIIGDHSSSNTSKLFEICNDITKTIWVENKEDFLSQNINLNNFKNIGITAGASTPICIIKEVHETMSEVLENQEELSFEEMLNQSFKSVSNGDKVKGYVTGIKPNEISVDIGTKHAGYVPLSELTDDPTAKPEDIVNKGDELELQVVRVNDVEGTVMLSKKRLDSQLGFEKVMNAANTAEILKGKITEVVKGGVLAITNGVKVFIPASQATFNKEDDLNSLLKQTVEFKILEANRGRKKAIGSIKAVAKESRKAVMEKFWSEIEEGKKILGKVKSLTDYGAFVDLGGVDGMVHISELSWGKIRHPSQLLKVGDSIEVFVKSIDNEKKKISLGYKKDEDNPWNVLEKNYKVDQIVKVKIVSLTAFGAFAEIIPGIDGLIHISQISNQHINKPADVLKVGQEVEAKITELDFENHRVSLSIRALLPEVEKVEKEEVTENN